MASEARVKAETLWIKIKTGLIELAPWFGLGACIGMLTGGYFGAIQNGQEIKRLNKRVDVIDKDLDGIVERHNENVDKYNSFVNHTHEAIDELRKQNNVLLTRALEETEGKKGA